MYDCLFQVGDMSGKSAVINFTSSEPVFAAQAHTKYVVKVRWSACGRYFATASYDKSARLYGPATAAPDQDGVHPYHPPSRVCPPLKPLGAPLPATFTPVWH